MLKFLGTGSAFADSHNCAFFIENNELVLLDCPATAFQIVKNWNLKDFDNIYVLVTHTHGDHSGGIGTFLQYVWFSNYDSNIKKGKKITVVAPSEKVELDLNLLLRHIEGCESRWFNITTADKLKKDWFVSAIKTTHTETLKDRCFGYALRIDGKNVIYTGDTATLEPYMEFITPGTYLFTEASINGGGVHIKLETALPELKKLSENGVKVYLMHLDNESKIKAMIEGTDIEIAPLWK